MELAMGLGAVIAIVTLIAERFHLERFNELLERLVGLEHDSNNHEARISALEQHATDEPNSPPTQGF